MKAIIDYQHEKSGSGSILINDERAFIAVTVATSKTFKSLKGAEGYMAKYGYKKVK